MKKASIFLSLFILLSASLLMPFSISANQSLSAPFLGINVYIIDRDNTYRVDSIDVDSFKLVCSANTSSSSGCQAWRDATNQESYLTVNSTAASSTIYKYDFILDAHYVGQLKFRYTTPSGSTANYTAYVNGNRFEFTILQGSETTITLLSYDLQRVVGDSWVYPIESFNVCSYMLNSLPQRYSGINSYNDYMFPIFKIQQNDIVYKTNVGANDNWTQTFIFYLNDSLNGANSFSNYFSIDRGEVLSYRQLNRFFFDGRIGYLCQVTIGNFTSSGVLNITYINSNDRYYMPIYCNAKVYNENVSTDFALLFGLSNRLLNQLDKIDLLVNGDSSSQQSSNQANQSNTQLSEEISNYNQVEQQLTDDFQNNLNAITVDSPLNILGSGFVQSANWVRTQFDSLTNNNPFGSLLTFSLILGVGLLIIGKVFG